MVFVKNNNRSRTTHNKLTYQTDTQAQEHFHHLDVTIAYSSQHFAKL